MSKQIEYGRPWWEVMKEVSDENARLKVKVERLRKAGDAVSLCLEAFWKGKPYDTSTNIKCFDAWNAAKEGRPNE